MSTYDVIVEPAGQEAFTIFAQAMDRTGFAAGTLAVTGLSTLNASGPGNNISLDNAGNNFGTVAIASAGNDHRLGANEAPPAMPVPSALAPASLAAKRLA